MTSVTTPKPNSQLLPRIVARSHGQQVQASAARLKVLVELERRNVGEAILRRARRITSALDWIAASSSIDVFLAELQSGEARAATRSAWREEIE
jgi:hypothetical protein